ncbi:molybdenum ABC transporter permease [Methanocalculus chunghsingensis]|uniref:Molybdenum ABC transporter permease n=1 Tax=Methanocalculus chunghsingensis TaxID=156457 RepID=A0A8J7W897_9EURY|nr:ABC transporter permease [Methanocalculus chunghsingensis]MBR1368043.1 molybdenum ABC transporter permease [Methanocalculus chunghsingensis]
MVERNPHRRRHYDRSLIPFLIPGSTIILVTILALGTLTVIQINDIERFLRIAGDHAVLHALFLTIFAGMCAVMILSLIGTPLAYYLARTKSRFRGIIESIVDIPLILPHTVAGILVYLLFMREGLIGAPMSAVGIIFEEAFPGIVAAMTFVSAPFYVNAVREGFEKVPVHLENAARTLGATHSYAFVTITLPLATREIVNGALLAWGRSIGEFAAVIIIAYYPMVISTLIYYRFTTGGIAEAQGLAFLMIVICFGIFLLVRSVTRFLGRYDDRV